MLQPHVIGAELRKFVVTDLSRVFNVKKEIHFVNMKNIVKSVVHILRMYPQNQKSLLIILKKQILIIF